MDAVRITDGVYWVGAVDWNVRDFHGYVTPRGTTYNAYLILDERVVLLRPTLEVQYVPDEEDLAKCVEFGRVAAEKLREGSP